MTQSFQFQKLDLVDLYLATPQVFQDQRGSFSRLACAREFTAVGVESGFVQTNIVKNMQAGTFRGLHFQRPPSREFKLVQCVAGSVLDIVVDLRKASKTFLKSMAIVLSAEEAASLLVPPGFAHGYITQTEGATLIYHHSDYYQPALDGGVRYDDPLIKLDQSLFKNKTQISARDSEFPLLPLDFGGL